jgi:hypothetical protein
MLHPEVTDVELIGLVLVFFAFLMVWLVAARPDLPKRILRALFEGLESTGRSYAIGLTNLHPTSPGDETKPADEFDAAEMTATGKLLDGTTTRADYHRAMAELARADAVRNPIRMP